MSIPITPITDIQSSKPTVPTQEELSQWVDDALSLFIKEHDSGRRFTAWEVALHLIAVYGTGYAIPHRSRETYKGVRDLVREKMLPYESNADKLYEAIQDIAPDGEQAIFWTPVQTKTRLPDTTTVVIGLAIDPSSPLQIPATITYTVDGFKFTD